MSRHYQMLDGAAVLATEDLLAARDLIGEITAAVAMGAIYGPAGTGKSFAVEEAIADRREVDYVRTDFRARPTMRYVRQELGRLLGVTTSTGAFEADWALKRALSERFRLVIIDEAQWLNRECFEYLRHLHDDPDTRFALLFVGGDGCYEVLRREPMLDSRLYAHQRFGPLTPAAVLAVIPTYHPIYAAADAAVLRLVDDTCGHGNFRSWARFTCHASRLCRRTGRTVCDEEIARNAFPHPRRLPWPLTHLPPPLQCVSLEWPCASISTTTSRSSARSTVAVLRLVDTSSSLPAPRLPVSTT